MNKTIQEVSKETLKLEGIFSTATPGEFFSYEMLQKLSNVKMDERGKSYMRSALKRLKLPYEVIIGNGIKILSAKNASQIVINKVVKIDNSIKRAEKTTKQVRARVYNQLTEPEQKNINFLGALFGTIRSYSASAKRIFSKEPLKIGERVKTN